MFLLPKNLIVGETEYEIETDFQTWLQVGKLLGIGSAEGLGKALLLVFKDSTLPNLKDALEALLAFYKRGRDKKGGNEKPCFDLEYDFGYVNAAFMHSYGIDLREKNIHWWMFWELFEALDPEEKIMKIIYYRSCDLNDIKNKDEKKRIRKMKELYALPTKKTIVTSEEMAVAMEELF